MIFILNEVKRMAFFDFFKEKKKQNQMMEEDAVVESTHSTLSEEKDTQEQENKAIEPHIIITDGKEDALNDIEDSYQLDKESKDSSDINTQLHITDTEDLSSSELSSMNAENITENVSLPLQDKERKGFFAKLLEGLDKTRKSILGGVDSVLGAFTNIDEDLFEELEEVLIMADLGVETTIKIIENLKRRVKKEKTTNPQDIKSMLIEEISALLQNDTENIDELKTPAVILVIGVNGVGKTTTIGKLASNLKSQGKSVMLAAADTFRAAAIDQLEIWGNRADIDVIKHQENSDPAAVIFDAVNAAKSRNLDVLICDTAGRLHNKKNLMDELKKISKVIDREYPQAHKEVYLVLDATTGQNAMQQARLFQEAAPISGIILTKLDGTAKGGIVIAIKSELQIPVRYIGVGEGIDDLQKFDAKEFAQALFEGN